MINFNLAVETAFASDRVDTDDQFEAFLDEVVSSFEQIGREVSLAARFSERVADFASTVQAPDFEAAVNSFLIDLRTALHAAGCNTSNWPQYEPTSRTVRELQDA